MLSQNFNTFILSCLLITASLFLTGCTGGLVETPEVEPETQGSGNGSENGTGSDSESSPNAVSQLLLKLNDNPLSVTLTWVDNAENESGFIIERKINEGDWALLTQLEVDAQEHVDTTVQRTTSYRYRVIAFNDHGQADPVESSTITITEEEQDIVFDAPVLLQSVENPQYCLAISGLDSESEKRVKSSACKDESNQRWVKDSIDRWHPAIDLKFCLTGSKENHGTVSVTSCDENADFMWNYQNNVLSLNSFAIDLVRSTLEVIMYRVHGDSNQQWLSIEPSSIDDNVESSQWTFVQVTVGQAYGSRTFDVPAAQNWVNSGLYLKAGQQASISATGEWRVNGNQSYGPEGSSSETQRGCALGELVARTGLYYEDSVTCIGASGSFTANRDGILFLGGIVSTDLGETYETRKNASGALTVTVVSEGDVVPTINHSQTSNYQFSMVDSGWIEILGEHTILTLPVPVAQQDAAEIKAAIDRLDSIYATHHELRGKLPYHGQPVRWFPDTEDAPGWMLAGNPVRMDPALVYRDNNDRITRAARDGNGNWGFAHELGHNFNFAGGEWYYTTFGGLESWPNIFSVHTQEQLNLPARNLNCDEKEAEYIANGTFEENFQNDVWLSLCFFMDFKERYGWEFYKNFYNEFNQSSGYGWGFLRQRFSAAAGEDVNALFDYWKIPQQ